MVVGGAYEYDVCSFVLICECSCVVIVRAGHVMVPYEFEVCPPNLKSITLEIKKFSDSMVSRGQTGYLEGARICLLVLW